MREWREYHITEAAYATNPTGTRPTPPCTAYLIFEQELQKYFMLHTAQEAAQDELAKLYMGKKTCEEYTTKFNGLALLAGYNETYLLRKYQDGLDANLQLKCVGSTPTPLTLAEWKTRALALDREYRRFSAMNQQGRPWKSSNQGQRKDENAMEIDAVQSNLVKKCTFCKRSGHLETECRTKNKSCFKCGKTGHHIQDCKEAPEHKICATETSGGGGGGADKIWDRIQSWSPEQQQDLARRFALGFA